MERNCSPTDSTETLAIPRGNQNPVWEKQSFDIYKWLSSNVLFGFLRNARHWTNSSARSLSLVINVWGNDFFTEVRRPGFSFSTLQGGLASPALPPLPAQLHCFFHKGVDASPAGLTYLETLRESRLKVFGVSGCFQNAVFAVSVSKQWWQSVIPCWQYQTSKLTWWECNCGTQNVAGTSWGYSVWRFGDTQLVHVI